MTLFVLSVWYFFIVWGCHLACIIDIKSRSYKYTENIDWLFSLMVVNLTYKMSPFYGKYMVYSNFPWGFVWCSIIEVRKDSLNCPDHLHNCVFFFTKPGKSLRVLLYLSFRLSSHYLRCDKIFVFKKTQVSHKEPIIGVADLALAVLRSW
jgi:hypothetical protein